MKIENRRGYKHDARDKNGQSSREATSLRDEISFDRRFDGRIRRNYPSSLSFIRYDRERERKRDRNVKKSGSEKQQLSRGLRGSDAF